MSDTTLDLENKAQNSVFEEDTPVSQRDEHDQLVLQLDGFDGPIDLLLDLSRDQKVDLVKISILDLANQYLDFVEKATELRLELAADYLVMAAWLAYLKSRMLVPEQEGDEDEPTGAELAEALAFQLRRLEALRNVADLLMSQKILGLDVFARGAPEGLKTISKSIHEANMFDLLSAYGQIQRRLEFSTYTVEAFDLLCIEEALERIEAILGKIPGEWMTIESFLPKSLSKKEKIVARSAIAATFGASLEMAKRGHIEIRQENIYGQIYIKKRRDGEKS